MLHFCEFALKESQLAGFLRPGHYIIHEPYEVFSMSVKKEKAKGQIEIPKFQWQLDSKFVTETVLI